VDELAHNECPRLAPSETWQDVDELLDAGLDVITALNVQHVESRADTVARSPARRSRDVPDSVLDGAVSSSWTSRLPNSSSVA